MTIRTRTMLHRLPTSELGGGLVAVGGITYATDSDEAVGRDAMARSPVLRETVWSRGFSALPGTLREIEAIAELYGASFPEGRSTVLSGREVTREAFIEAASGARFLHVATHGWFSPRPLPRGTAEDGVRGLATIWSDRVRALSPSSLCGLALAGANAAPDRLGQVPGLLTAEEVSALDLSACELAVLSACETGVGIAGAGVGVASLQKALHVAGARWVLTSLWKVDDRSALALMQSFYRGLWAEGLPPGEALWQAKNELRSRRRPPAEWAGWVLTSAPAAPTNGEAEEPTIRDR